MGLILRSIERIPKMKFSMAHKFMLHTLQRYNVKRTEKNHKRNFTFDELYQEKTKQLRRERTTIFWIPSLALYKTATLTLVDSAKL